MSQVHVGQKVRRFRCNVLPQFFWNTFRSCHHQRSGKGAFMTSHKLFFWNTFKSCHHQRSGKEAFMTSHKFGIFLISLPVTQKWLLFKPLDSGHEHIWIADSMNTGIQIICYSDVRFLFLTGQENSGKIVCYSVHLLNNLTI